MKLQNLAIIFIIIIIPIVFVFSFYLKLETKTIKLQTDYDGKLIQATKEAIEAFEINTVEWSDEYSTLTNVKRQDLMSSINVFTASLANKLGVGGISRENILTYVPAIVYTMYDGYYIYSPTHIPQTITDDKGKQCFYYENASKNVKITTSAIQNIGGTIYAGEPIYELKEDETATGVYNGKGFTTDRNKAKTIYKHVLKTFVPYTAKYVLNGEKYVINYSLDNFIRIYGEDVAREGYIIDNFGNSNKIELRENNVSGITFNGKSVDIDMLEENIPVKIGDTIEVKSYNYIYNSNNDKRYYNNEGKFFIVDKNYNMVPLPDTEVGSTLAEYKKLCICTDLNKGEFIELYQLLNGSGSNKKWFYINDNNEYIEYNIQPIINEKYDCSSINYYVETYCFNKWLRGGNGLKLNEDDIQSIIYGKNQAIISNINNNLNLSMSNYSANSKIDYKLPELTDDDWNQALSNISMITFLQGQKIGLKTYNNYVVVSSTENNEFVSENYLYYYQVQKKYYHRFRCSSSLMPYQAYRNIDFNLQSYYDENGDITYYYKYKDSFGDHYECFDCIVNRNNYQKEGRDTRKIDAYERFLYTALARERYIQMQRTKLTK